MSNIFDPVVFLPEEVGYSVRVPDLDGCYSEGDTMNEAFNNIKDAIGLHLDDQVIAWNPGIVTRIS